MNVKNPWENRCFQIFIVFSFGSIDNSNKCTVLWKIAARLIAVSTSVNNEMWVKLRLQGGSGGGSYSTHGGIGYGGGGGGAIEIGAIGRISVSEFRVFLYISKRVSMLNLGNLGRLWTTKSHAGDPY